MASLESAVQGLPPPADGWPTILDGELERHRSHSRVYHEQVEDGQVRCLSILGG